MNHNLIYTFTLIIFLIALAVSIYSFIRKKKIQDGVIKNKLEEDEHEKAKKLLTIHGYKMNKKSKYSYFFSLNGRYAEVILKPDFSVRKGWQNFAVIVNKTAKGVAENSILRKSATEFYYTGYFSGILILDLEKQEIDKILYINKKEELNKKIYRGLLIVIFILLTISVFFFLNFIVSKT